MLRKLALLAALPALSPLIHAQEIIPQPASMEVRADAPGLTLKQVSLAAPREIAPWAAGVLGKDWGVKIAAADSAAANVRLEIDASLRGGELPEHTISVNDKGVVIRAAGVDGLRHGVQSLRLLAKVTDGAALLPQCTIKDSPRLRYRGLLLDSSRHMQSVAGIKRLLDQMALLKLNVFHWHLTDNQGWRAEVPSKPRLAKVGGFLSKTPEVERNGYYTTAQLREVGDYARSLGIEVIPELDVPGHSSALVEAYPEFLCPTNKRPPASTWTHNNTPNHVVCVGNEALYPFLVTAFKETAAAIGAKRVHIGGDEVEEGIWSKCPHCSAVMKKEGLKKEYELERHFLERLSLLLKKEGLQTMNWLERPKVSIPKVDATIAWRGAGTGAGHVEAAAAAGIPVVNAKGDYAYFDYPQFGGTCKSGWMPTLPLDRVYNFKVVPDVVAQNHPELMLGGECTLWTEEVLEKDIDAQLFPRLLAFAEQMWTPDSGRSFDDFKRRLEIVKPALEKRGVRFAAPVDRSKIITVTGAKVECSLKHRGHRFPEYALDDNDITAFVSEDNAKAGDTFTVSFDRPTKARKVTVLTGCYYLHDEKTNARVKSAVLEASKDGATWAKLADFKDGFASAPIPAGTKGLRMRLTADQGARMNISDFRLE